MACRTWLVILSLKLHRNAADTLFKFRWERSCHLLMRSWTILIQSFATFNHNRYMEFSCVYGCCSKQRYLVTSSGSVWKAWVKFQITMFLEQWRHMWIMSWIGAIVTAVDFTSWKKLEKWQFLIKGGPYFEREQCSEGWVVQSCLARWK